MTDEYIQNAFKAVFAIQVELLEALEDVSRSTYYRDYNNHFIKARALIDAVKAVAEKHDAESK